MSTEVSELMEQTEEEVKTDENCFRRQEKFHQRGDPNEDPVETDGNDGQTQDAEDEEKGDPIATGEDLDVSHPSNAGVVMMLLRIPTRPRPK